MNLQCCCLFKKSLQVPRAFRQRTILILFIIKLLFQVTVVSSLLTIQVLLLLNLVPIFLFRQQVHIELVCLVLLHHGMPPIKRGLRRVSQWLNFGWNVRRMQICHRWRWSSRTRILLREYASASIRLPRSKSSRASVLLFFLRQLFIANQVYRRNVTSFYSNWVLFFEYLQILILNRLILYMLDLLQFQLNFIVIILLPQLIIFFLSDKLRRLLEFIEFAHFDLIRFVLGCLSLIYFIFLVLLFTTLHPFTWRLQINCLPLNIALAMICLIQTLLISFQIFLPELFKPFNLSNTPVESLALPHHLSSVLLLLVKQLLTLVLPEIFARRENQGLLIALLVAGTRSIQSSMSGGVCVARTEWGAASLGYWRDGSVQVWWTRTFLRRDNVFNIVIL